MFIISILTIVMDFDTARLVSTNKNYLIPSLLAKLRCENVTFSFLQGKNITFLK